MLARLRKAKENGESGFTLIELLVVVIIIGILAAIAIPTFLNQRKGAWEKAAQSDLRNAAVIMEEQFSLNGTYAAADLSTLKESTNNVVTLAATPVADDNGYCLDAQHSQLKTGADGTDIDFHLDSTVGVPAPGACA